MRWNDSGRRPLVIIGRSEHDVERVAQRLVEPGACDVVKPTHRRVVQIVERDRDDVVATDDTWFGKTMLGVQLHL